MTRPALTRPAAAGALLVALAVALTGCSGGDSDSASAEPSATPRKSFPAVTVSDLTEQQRADLLQRLGQVDPALDSGRSVGRARNVCIGVLRGLPEPELVATVQDRFTDVAVDDAQAARILTAIRETFCS